MPVTDHVVVMYDDDTLQRFMAKITQSEPDGCWNWTAAVRTDAYGVIAVIRPTDGKKGMRAAHRVSYELFVGPIPDGLDIDHLCRNKLCVRPDHLEPVTRFENLRRGNTFVAEQTARTHCPQGHSYDEVNTIRSGAHRECRTCHNERQRARWHSDPERRARLNARRRERWAEGR